ncbi:MAG: ArsC/Spx/MgsR family protein [Planktotalea sp.]|uniref:ArsC/Spx/MgsR family protein n=1 Tax=Planktotalea sp. TaxID=2029877 RepID=UPI003C7934A4
MKLYGLKNCDTCRKALKNLPNAVLVDVRSEGVPRDVLQTAYERFDAALLNTRSTTWRGLSAEERQRPALDLITDHPALMKRPLIDDAGTLYLGWGRDVQAALVG